MPRRCASTSVPTSGFATPPTIRTGTDGLTRLQNCSPAPSMGCPSCTAPRSPARRSSRPVAASRPRRSSASRPLACTGLLDAAMPIVVEAKVGSSAGGAQPGEATHHAHRSGEVRSYAPTGHRHSAEIIQELHLGGGRPRCWRSPRRPLRPSAACSSPRTPFSPATLTIANSGSSTGPGMRPSRSCASSRRAPVCIALPIPSCSAARTTATWVSSATPNSRRVVVTAALDNLVKGSAGQAVQAFNVRHGFPETLGLEFGGLYPI